MKIKLELNQRSASYNFFEFYKNCDDLIEYLKSLNIYKGEMINAFSYSYDILYYFSSHFRKVPITEQLTYLAIKYPHLLKVSDEN